MATVTFENAQRWYPGADVPAVPGLDLDESGVARTPTVVYGVNLMAAGTAYYLLQRRMMRLPVTGPRLRDVVGNDLKGKASPFIYLFGIMLAFVEPWLALLPYAAVALIWLVPDRRVERYFAAQREALD